MRLSSRKILYTALFSCKFSDLEDRNLQENKTKRTKSIEVRAIGKPSFKDLPHYQSEAFYSLLLKHIAEFAEKGGK